MIKKEQYENDIDTYKRFSNLVFNKKTAIILYYFKLHQITKRHTFLLRFFL